MQNQTARPASTGKRGIPLSQQLFAKAIDKALAVKPRVFHIGAHYGVLMSDQRNWAHVAFCVWDGRIFATCTCRAHTHGDHGKPVPCYHIAAAALMRNAAAFIAASEQRACVTVPRAYPRHDHACTACRTLYSCTCSHGEIDDLICDDCGSEQLDWANAYANHDKAAWV